MSSRSESTNSRVTFFSFFTEVSACKVPEIMGRGRTFDERDAVCGKQLRIILNRSALEFVLGIMVN